MSAAPMTSVNVSLPGPMRAYVEEQVAKGSYGTVSEFIRAAIREKAERQAEAELEAKLLEGLDSGPPIEADEAYWQAKRAALEQRLRKAQAR